MKRQVFNLCCLCVLLLSMTVSGCSSVWVSSETLTDGRAPNLGRKHSGIGVTYYEPMFVAVVTCGEHGSTQVSIETLPDIRRPRTVRWRTGLGNVHPAVALENGWRLASLDGEATSGASDLVAQGGSVLSSVIGTLSILPGGERPAHDLTPGVYRLNPVDWSVQEPAIIPMAACPTPQAD